MAVLADVLCFVGSPFQFTKIFLTPGTFKFLICEPKQIVEEHNTSYTTF
jgi:hypothetical protein